VFLSYFYHHLLYIVHGYLIYILKPTLSPEHYSAISRNEKLQEEFLVLDTQLIYLQHHEIPALELKYLKLLGKNQLERMELKSQVYRNKRRAEMIQACLNRNEKITLALIDVLVDIEIQDELKKLKRAAGKLAAALSGSETKLLTDEERVEFKKLYYSLAKKLHPDLNPEQKSEDLSFWHNVSEAYQNGDLDTLRLLTDLLDSDKPAPENVKTLLEELLVRNERLVKGIKKLLTRIDVMKDTFPLNIKKFLDDEKWVTEQNNILLNDISRLHGENNAWQTRVELLMSSNNE